MATENLSYKETKEFLEKYYMECSTVDRGQLVGDQIVVSKTNKVPAGEKDTATTQIYSIKEDGSPVNTGIVVPVDGTVVASNWTKSGSKRVLIKELAEKQYAIEVFQQGSQVYRREIKEKFKAICGAPALTSAQVVWSEDGNRLMFLAERIVDKEAASEDVFDPKVLTKFEYQHNFGEQHQKFYDLDVIIIDLKDKKLFKVDNIPEKLVVTYPLFANANGTSLVFNGLDSTRFLSGISLCNNKPTTVYHLPELVLKEIPEKPPKKDAAKDVAPKEADKPKDTPESDKPKVAEAVKVSSYPIVLNPIVHPSGNIILYFFTSKYKEHHKFALGLASYDVASKTTTVLRGCEDGETKPLFVCSDMYSALHWIDQDHVSFRGYQCGTSVIHVMNIKTKVLKTLRLIKDFELDNIKVLDISASLLVVGLVNFHTSGLVGVVKNWSQFNDGDKANISWEQFTPRLSKIEEIVLKHQDVVAHLWRLENFKLATGEAVRDDQRPLLLVLHGGPHWFMGVNGGPYLETVLQNGFQVMTVNFSGSWSYTSDFNDRLAGKIGELDIEEILAILRQLEGKYKKDSLFLDGGSYSGYQGFVFLQKHPHLFTGIISRNPVVNLIQMLAATDIPEWNLVEALGSETIYDVGKELTDKELLRLKEASPALNAYDATSKTKVLLILGDSDRRVPPAGGYAIFRKLKALGLNINLLEYKGEGHGIVKSKHVFDINLNALNILMPFK